MSHHSHTSAESFWNQLYEKKERIWSGRANAPLVEAAGPLRPGTVLDLGCGEGGDAVWLAEHGWRVIATDMSTVALSRAKQLATERNVEDRIDFQWHDLEIGFPSGKYDLVSAQYLQSPLDFQRQKVLRKAAAAVATDGRLIIVEHAAAPPWSEHRDHTFPTARETFDSLELDTAKWHVESLGSPERQTTGPAGTPATIKDNVILIKRLAD